MKSPLSIDLDKAAALFVDLQEEHRRDLRYLVEDFHLVIANAQRLQHAARMARIPVFHSAYVVDLDAPSGPRFHPVLPDGRSAFSDKGDPLTKICPEVGPSGDERVLFKSEASVFGAEAFADHLRARGVEWIFVAGVWTEACVHATVADAVALGFRALVIKDACGSGATAMHQTAMLNIANRLYGGAVVDTDRAIRLMAGETEEAWQVSGAVPLRFTYETASDLYRDL